MCNSVELWTIFIVLSARNVYSFYSMPKMLLPNIMPPGSNDIRLVDGPNPLVGRLEIFHNDTWGNICVAGVDRHTVTVACRQLYGQLGLEEEDLKGSHLLGTLYEVDNDNPFIWLDNIQCDGSEETLMDCSNSIWGESDCYRGSSSISCVKRAGCANITDEIYTNGNVSACNGKYNDIEDAEIRGCNAFHHVCNSAEELRVLNFTPNECLNIGNNNEFYATLEGIQDNKNKCQPSINGIWGCSSSINSVNSVTSDTSMCSPLTDVLRNGKISDADGILCCPDRGWMDVDWEDMSYIVSLRNKNDHSCGGSILTLNGHNGNGAILTAAHCLLYQLMVGYDISDLKIAVGCTTTACNTQKDSGKHLYSVESFVTHEKWNISTLFGEQGVNWNENDIAIIFLTQPINHSKAIPIIIESNPMIAENNGIVKLTGYYGYDSSSGGRGGSDNTELEYGFTNIMTRNECQKYHNQTIITSNDFCVKDDKAFDNMITPCNGDSGSPLLYKGKQIGLVSFGAAGCDPFYPQVATFVPSFYQWIINKCGKECFINDGYIGCYKDETALTKEITGKDKFSIDKCQKKCNGYKYFALQNEGGKCFCENDYELATKYGTSRKCISKLGGIISNSLFVHSGFEQKQYLPDNVLKNDMKLEYGPGKGVNNDVIYTVESCRISCSNFKYFSVSNDGECKCGNEYYESYNKQEYDRYGLFKNVLKDGIEINVNCDNYLRNISFINDEYNQYVELLSNELYNYDDWTKTQTVIIPNSANCGKVRIICANAENDNGPAGLMIGIKYNKQYVSSNKETINNIITLVNKNGNNNQIVLSSQTSITPLSNEPYFAKWIWTCGDDGQWDKCDPGLENIFQIDLCKLSVANAPNVFIPKNKTVIYWILSTIFVMANIVLLSICCFKSSFLKYTKVKRVYFDDSDVESDEV